MAIIEKHIVPGHLVFAVAGQAPHEIGAHPFERWKPLPGPHGWYHSTRSPFLPLFYRFFTAAPNWTSG
jgi:hypothetical protein